jgi:23S rRNA pseudouridine955/2504/2580 synthase
VTNPRLATVAAEDAGLRLDRWFRRHYPKVPHGRLQKLLRGGQIRVDGGRVQANTRLMEGQSVRVPPLGERANGPRKVPVRAPSAADMAVLERAVLHRDDDVIVLNKPPGLAVQGGTRTHRHLDAMLDGLCFGSSERPRLVHRLDKDTSGALLLARHRQAAAALTSAFRGKAVRKLYWALVAGAPTNREGRIDEELAKRLRGEREAVEATKSGRAAATLYRQIETAGGKITWLALTPLTGRTHQLRVHCAHLGTPVVGDRKYGGPAAALAGEGIASGLHLHARSIALPHPNGSRLDVTAPLPDHMAATFSFLGFDAGGGSSASAP